MKKLLEFYNARTDAVDKDDLLTQVGHTIGGRPINDDQLTQMVAHIQSMLKLEKTDCLLDLCCGNGLITNRVSAECGYTLGVDFTRGLIDIASANFATDEQRFECLDVKRLSDLKTEPPKPFNKILLYAALQHFTDRELYKILSDLESLTAPPSTVVLGFVPLKSRKWELYNTWSKKTAHFRRLIAGKELITKWWTFAEIAKTAAAFGYESEAIDMPPVLSEMNYRFNIRLTKP